MAENGWTQGVCQEEPGFPRLLINSLERLGITERPRYHSREYEHLGTRRCRVVLSIARSTRHPDIEPWRVNATGFRHQDAYPLAIRKALRYLCRIFEEHLVPTPMRLFPPDASLAGLHEELERRRQHEDLLYHVVVYLVSLDKLFDEQAQILREQTHRAEQAELAVRMHQIRVAQAEARTAAAISSEAVAQESLRQIQDRRMQEWTSGGTPVPAIGETQVLIGTPITGWGGLFRTPQAPPEGTERTAAAIEGGAVEQPRENGILEDDEEELLIPLEVHSAPEDDSPHE
ncbi:LOW QUALITY PROTEIN: hypothetical protein PAHAL_1G185900 [Panicum hallii]|uniref:Uncharacterized protein n=1 Tax=Panicum hallii TaxID=206008 RepID=A0A2T8KVP4_9POAL|nr:LOW QUALITY PROTEIN: hypothetical protein PAHAL_1G185900 [Panicum hallii]